MHLIIPRYHDNLTPYHTWQKVGGKMSLINVQIRGAPYPKVFSDGKIAAYADVYGYGFRGSVNVLKLKIVAKQE